MFSKRPDAAAAAVSRLFGGTQTMLPHLAEHSGGHGVPPAYLPAKAGPA